jgi:hypothetical protein
MMRAMMELLKRFRRPTGSGSFVITLENSNGKQVVFVSKELLKPGERIEIRSGKFSRSGCITFARDGRYSLAVDNAMRATDIVELSVVEARRVG